MANHRSRKLRGHQAEKYPPKLYLDIVSNYTKSKIKTKRNQIHLIPIGS